jgi:hypothetical protein
MLQEIDNDKFKMYLTRKVIAWFRRWLFERHERHGKVIGASSSDAGPGGDASSSNPGSAAAVAVPKARVQAPSVSEDEDCAELIVPDGEGGASVGYKWVLPDKEIICYARQYPEGPVEG